MNVYSDFIIPAFVLNVTILIFNASLRCTINGLPGYRLAEKVMYFYTANLDSPDELCSMDSDN
jgi:hypothetical protein